MEIFTEIGFKPQKRCFSWNFFPQFLIFSIVAKKDTSADVSEAADSEVVKDPFAEDVSKDKKASLLALTNGDSAVAQAALEQERINDIYFTSKKRFLDKWQAFCIFTQYKNDHEILSFASKKRFQDKWWEFCIFTHLKYINQDEFRIRNIL